MKKKTAKHYENCSKAASNVKKQRNNEAVFCEKPFFQLTPFVSFFEKRKCLVFCFTLPLMPRQMKYFLF